MPADRRAPVAIIGAGFSGTMAAAQLAQRGVRSILVEDGGRAGQGIAFSTSDPAHLLNVPAGNMSAWPDRPDDFAARGGDGSAFAQRRQFGAYLSSILNEAVFSGRVGLVEDRAVSARREGNEWQIGLESGGRITADALVLATGNQPPQKLRVLEPAGERLIDDPWGARAREAIQAATAGGSDVLIVGTGLTMVDTVLSLDAAGFRGRIFALSRRGLIPRAHQAHEPATVAREEIPAGNTRLLSRWLRRRSAEGGWRAAIDALRPHSPALWQALCVEQQRRFLRHARPWWDVHRHRIAPEVGEKLRRLIAAGRLQVIAGRVTRVDPAGDCLRVSFTRRGRGSGSEETVEVAYLFNCTGPLGEIGRTRDPLLRQMLDDGLICPDALGIGLAVDQHAQVDGAERLWALGALTKGRFWEIIAVPDIRGQAAAVAEDIATELQA